MKTKFTIKNDYGQLSNEIDIDITPEEMLDLMWILLTTIYSLDVTSVRIMLEEMRQRPNLHIVETEELTNVWTTTKRKLPF